MESLTKLDENWQVLLSMFPTNWRELAKETGAITRRLRNFEDEESILRTLLLHLANGYSLRETVTRAKVANLANVSDVSLLKRLKCSEGWLKELCLCLLRERGLMIKAAPTQKNINMKLVNGTHVKEPGKTGSQWRIHYSLKLPDLQCDYFKLTEVEGIGTGESFKQFPVSKGDCIIGDRGYSTSQGIAYLARKKAYSLVRVNTNALNFYTEDKKEFNLLAAVASLEKEYQVGEWLVKLSVDSGQWIEGRLCAIRKSQTSAEKAVAQLKKEASKKQRAMKPETLEFAKYVTVFTTLPLKSFPANSILEWYRLRWQIELIFKRLKSLTGFGHLPKYDEQSSRAWLYGKLLVGLLIEKLIHYSSAISPWGYCL